MVLGADGFETLVRWDSRLRAFLGAVSSLAPISPTFSSATIVRFLSGFLSNSLLTKLCIRCYLELFLLGTGTEIFWDILQETYILNTVPLDTRCWTAYDSMHVVIAVNGWLRTALREANAIIHGARVLQQTANVGLHVSKHCHWLIMAA
jgi:hypothetical protein